MNEEKEKKNLNKNEKGIIRKKERKKERKWRKQK